MRARGESQRKVAGGLVVEAREQAQSGTDRRLSVVHGRWRTSASHAARKVATGQTYSAIEITEQHDTFRALLQPAHPSRAVQIEM